MRKDELKLIAMHGTIAFTQDAGLRYDPTTKEVVKYGLEPGVDLYGAEIYRISIPDPHITDWEWRHALESLRIPSVGWEHEAFCNCSDCVRGAHDEVRADGGHQVVSADGVTLYDVSADGWSGD